MLSDQLELVSCLAIVDTFGACSERLPVLLKHILDELSSRELVQMTVRHCIDCRRGEFFRLRLSALQLSRHA